MRLSLIALCCLATLLVTADQEKTRDHVDEAWRAAQIEDALRAAPATVTADAAIYAWNRTQLVLVRQGSGSYTCVASGSWSLRLGKPSLPYPDPFCADQNAYAYIRAVWNERDPLRPTRPFPRAPGLVWMLAGMNVVDGGVAYSADGTSTLKVGGDTNGVITMTPHLMILPLPIDPRIAGLPGVYDPANEHAMWIMGANTPTAHLHVHFTPSAHNALKNLK
jgi:hypothetical protein